MQTQTARILKHLKSGKPLDPMLALRKYGSFRLGARIFQLRQAGHLIERTIKTRGRKHWAEYRMGR